MLLKGILAHADVHLYDTCTDGEGERGVWVGCEGTDDVGSACRCEWRGEWGVEDVGG